MLSFISGLFFLAGIFYLFLGVNLGRNTPKLLTKNRSVALGLLAAALLFGSIETIPSGSKGLRFTFGKLNQTELSPGLVFKLPFIQNIETITIRPIQLDNEIDVGSGGAITKDNQTIGATLTIFYQYKENELVKMWGQYGKEKILSILTQSEVESFKATIGIHAIFDIPVNQDSIRTGTLTNIRTKMSGYPIEVTELKITNYDWSDEFDKQIQETMHRAQQVKQKQQELLITEQEAQKKVKEAEADKTSMVTRAEGEKAAAILMADAKEAEGAGIKKYNQAVQANMELELKIRALEIEKIKAEKWDGAYVPVNNYGPIPISSGSGLSPK